MAEPLYTEDDVQAAWTALRETPDYFKPATVIRTVLDAAAPGILARELRRQAESTIAETVCCDVYKKYRETGTRPDHFHDICYWGAAHAEALNERADEIEEAAR